MGQYVEEEEVVSFVNITSITVEDGGTYLCKTENRVGKEVHFASINVFGEIVLFMFLYFLAEKYVSSSTVW